MNPYAGMSHISLNPLHCAQACKSSRQVTNTKKGNEQLHYSIQINEIKLMWENTRAITRKRINMTNKALHIL